MRIVIFSLLVLAVLAAAAWAGLPAGLHALGLHPDYKGPRYSFSGGRALIVTTSHGQLGETGRATGVFASEMTAPYYAFLDGGMTVDVASIEGGAIPVDPQSLRWFIRMRSDERFLADADFQRKTQNSLAIGGVDFTSYDIVYLAGGWGAAFDFATSEVLGQKISEAWAAGKVVGGICHGPLGLLRAQDEGGKPLVAGRRLTAVSDLQVEQLGIEMTPYHPERELRNAGALYEKESAVRDIFADHVVADGRLVTGQNQNAGTEIAHLMMTIAKNGAGKEAPH